MGNSHTVRIVLCIAIIASFFLPLNSSGGESFGISFTAWSLLMDTFKNIDHIKDFPPSALIIVGCLLVVLLFTVVILFASLGGRSMSGLVNMLPLIGMAIMVGYSIN